MKREFCHRFDRWSYNGIGIGCCTLAFDNILDDVEEEVDKADMNIANFG